MATIRTSLRRIGNLAAWLSAALISQVAIILLLSFYKPDSAYGIRGTFFFASLFNVIGTICGLIGYALAASFLQSTASMLTSALAGGGWVLISMYGVYIAELVPPTVQLPVAMVICGSFGAISYAWANRRPDHKSLR